MSKLNQRGVVHLFLPLILLLGIIAGVYLITQGNPLKLFSRATNPPIVFKDLNGNVLPLNSNGIPKTTSPNARVELTSTLGSPVSVSDPISGPISNHTVSYKAGFDPTQLDAATFIPYTAEPTTYNVGFQNTLGTQFYWVEFKSANGTVDRRSAQIEIVADNSQRVFITSTTYNGNLGGLSGADAKCQERANAANLGGTWKAWLSTYTVTTSSRLAHSIYPYKLVNGTTIASNWEELTRGSGLQHTINLNEVGLTVEELVWTDTNENGNSSEYSDPPAFRRALDCSEWTSSDSTKEARNGGSGLTDYRWTKNGYTYCSAALHLYCVEQIAETSSPSPIPTPQSPSGGVGDIPIIGPIIAPFFPTPTPVPTSIPTPQPVVTSCPGGTVREECIGYASNNINTYCWGENNAYLGGKCSSSCTEFNKCGLTTTGTPAPTPSGSSGACADSSGNGSDGIRCQVNSYLSSSNNKCNNKDLYPYYYTNCSLPSLPVPTLPKNEQCDSGQRKECIEYSSNGINAYCWKGSTYIKGICSSSCTAYDGCKD